MEIEIKPYEQGGYISQRVEDRLGLPANSVVHVSKTTGEFLRFNTELTEQQKQALKSFLGDRLF